jgi:hypothetical protein
MAMGFFAYLILSILFYQNAMADSFSTSSTEELDAFSLGYTYEVYADEEGNNWGFALTMQSLLGSVFTLATAECTSDGETDFACTNARYQAILNHIQKVVEKRMGDGTNKSTVDLFYLFCEDIGLDKNVQLGSAMALFVTSVVRHFETTS